VERNIQDFTRRNRHLVMLEKKAKYWPMITRVLKDRHIPAELGYVVWVESQFDPEAVSPVGAAGLWQIMPETAREYGLTVNSERDERFDPQRSTEAAAMYITDLLRMFKSKRYLLALASYNTGQYRVMRSQLGATVSEAGRADFWQIRHLLPKETNMYVPRIMAAMIIGRNARRYEPAVAH
jgi:membrane-bound lytic murein transglycosylase D